MSILIEAQDSNTVELFLHIVELDIDWFSGLTASIAGGRPYSS